MKHLKKIISGGQTGADRAALDTAIKFNINHGGWIPKGRKTEDGPLSLKYDLMEMDTADYRERTKQNIIDSHGTVIISRGKLTGGSLLTRTFAKVVGRPSCYIDLLNCNEFEASLNLQSFILENSIEVLNVAGPRISNDPGIYGDVKIILEAVIYMIFLESKEEKVLKKIILPDNIKEAFPVSVEDAVDLITQDLTLKFKIFIARLDKSKIGYLYFPMLDCLRKRLGFDSQNDMLLKECSMILKDESCSVEDAVMEILKQLKIFLEKHYLLKVVK